MTQIKETKFTPGPWKRDGFFIRTQRGVIAHIPVPQVGGVFDCNFNTDLIAAAPALYEACVEFLNGLEILARHNKGEAALDHEQWLARKAVELSTTPTS